MATRKKSTHGKPQARGKKPARKPTSKKKVKRATSARSTRLARLRAALRNELGPVVYDRMAATAKRLRAKGATPEEIGNVLMARKAEGTITATAGHYIECFAED